MPALPGHPPNQRWWVRLQAPLARPWLPARADPPAPPRAPPSPAAPSWFAPAEARAVSHGKQSNPKPKRTSVGRASVVVVVVVVEDRMGERGISLPAAKSSSNTDVLQAQHVTYRGRPPPQASPSALMLWQSPGPSVQWPWRQPVHFDPVNTLT